MHIHWGNLCQCEQKKSSFLFSTWQWIDKQINRRTKHSASGISTDLLPSRWPRLVVQPWEWTYRCSEKAQDTHMMTDFFTNVSAIIFKQEPNVVAYVEERRDLISAVLLSENKCSRQTSLYPYYIYLYHCQQHHLIKYSLSKDVTLIYEDNDTIDDKLTTLGLYNKTFQWELI